jgi:hypothetical protein
MIPQAIRVVQGYDEFTAEDKNIRHCLHAGSNSAPCILKPKGEPEQIVKLTVYSHYDISLYEFHLGT